MFQMLCFGMFLRYVGHSLKKFWAKCLLPVWTKVTWFTNFSKYAFIIDDSVLKFCTCLLLHMAHISLIDIFVLALAVCPLGRSENPVEMVGSASSLVFDRFQKFKKTNVSTRWANLGCDLEFDLDLKLDLEKLKKAFSNLNGRISVSNRQKCFKCCVSACF